VNLIPWNPVEGMSFEGRPLQEPSPGETAAFTRALEERGFKVTRRFRKGRDISGACGQLGEIVPAERRDPGPPHEGPLKTPHLSPPG
jgi:23S rRNA (adenine2503-C2)-methyltransferase